MATGRQDQGGEQEAIVAKLKNLVAALQQAVEPDAKRIKQQQSTAKRDAEREEHRRGNYQYAYPEPKLNLAPTMYNALAAASAKLEEPQGLPQNREQLIQATLGDFFEPLYKIVMFNPTTSQGQMYGYLHDHKRFIGSVVLVNEAHLYQGGYIATAGSALLARSIAHYLYDGRLSGLEVQYGWPHLAFFEKLHEILNSPVAEDFKNDPAIERFVGMLNASFGFAPVTAAQKVQLDQLATEQTKQKEAANDKAKAEREAADKKYRAEQAVIKQREREEAIDRKRKNINSQITALGRIGTAAGKKKPVWESQKKLSAAERNDQFQKQFQEAAWKLKNALQEGVKLPEETMQTLTQAVEDAITQNEERLRLQYEAEKKAEKEAAKEAAIAAAKQRRQLLEQQRQAAERAQQPNQAAEEEATPAAPPATPVSSLQPALDVVGQHGQDEHESRIQAWLAQPGHGADEHDWTAAQKALVDLVNEYAGHLRKHKQIDDKGQGQGKGGGDHTPPL
jgi:hypothetical protein